MRILIADDEPIVRRLLALALEDADLIMAKDGEEAIMKAKDEQPDIILMDVMMPPGTYGGFAALKCLKADEATAEIPVVLMSAVFIQEEYVKRGLGLGAVDYLTKPFDDIHGLLEKLEGYAEEAKKKAQDGPGLTKPQS